MSDIATLGIKVDSSQVAAGTTALDKFAAAAKPATASTSALEKAVKDAAKGVVIFDGNIGGTTENVARYRKAIADAAAATSPLDTATKSVGKSTTIFDTAAKSASKSTKDIATAGNLAGHEMTNLWRQIQDVVVSLQGGQGLGTVALQQGTQIADIYGSSKTGSVGGSIKQVASSIASFMTPMRVLGIGIAATGIAAVAAYGNWKTYTLQLDDTAKQANTTTRELSALQAAAGFKGISGDDFTKGIQSFSQQIYLAKQNAGGLLDVFRANGVQVGTFSGSLEKAADLIKNAKDDQARLVLLQQMGLPANMQWVRLMSDGADGIRKAKAAAAEFSADDSMINRARAFDEAWNRTWTNFSLNARSAFQRALDGGANFFDRMERLAQKAGNASLWSGLYDQKSAAAAGVTLTNNFDGRMSGDMANPASGNAALQDALRRKADALNNKNTVDPNALKNAISVEQQRIGILGQTASVLDQVRSVELQIQSARLNGVKITDQEAAKLKSLAEANAIGLTQIRAQADSSRIEAETVGMSVGATAAYTAEMNRLNQARRDGQNLSPDQIAAIRAEATALGDAAQRADLMRSAYEGLVRGPMQTFQQQLANGATFFDALKASGVSALNAISSKLMDMASQGLWKAAMGGASGGGGLLSTLFGGSAFGAQAAPLSAFPVPLNHTGYGPGDALNNVRYVHPAHFNDAPRFHSGIGPGERAAIIRTDESVLTPGQMKAMGKTGGGGTVVNITNNNTFNGADPSTEARMRSYVDQSSDRTVQRAVQAVSQVKETRPGFAGGVR